MLFRKNSSSHEPRLGRQLLAHFENADAMRRTIPLLPSSWKELWAVYQLS